MKKRYMVFGLGVVLALSLAVPALGGPSNPVASISASAKSTAKKALKTAKAAKSAAKKAQSTADAANTAAGAAQTTADGAKTAAATAQTTANSAQTAATAAQTAATNAQTTADSKMSGLALITSAGSAGGSTSATEFAVCPTGKSTTGGGFLVNGANNDQVTVVANAPYIGSWFAIAKDINGQAGTSWTLTAEAECATSP